MTDAAMTTIAQDHNLRTIFESLETSGMHVDSNRAGLAERIAGQILRSDTTLTTDEAVTYANERAAELMPSAREAARQIARLRTGPTYCYLAFFGLSNRCRYVKVGRSSHPEQRVYGMTTGNPLDLMGVFACRFETLAAAHHAEQSMLRALRPISRRGEWIEIDEIDRSSMAVTADHLGGSIQMPDGARPRFEPFWLPGRKAA